MSMIHAWTRQYKKQETNKFHTKHGKTWKYSEEVRHMKANQSRTTINWSKSVHQWRKQRRILRGMFWIVGEIDHHLFLSNEAISDLRSKSNCCWSLMDLQSNSMYFMDSWGRRPDMKKGKSWECVTSMSSMTLSNHLSVSSPSSLPILSAVFSSGSSSLSSFWKCSLQWSYSWSPTKPKKKKRKFNVYAWKTK